ncbi:dynactin subunit 6 isoform X1 [Cygnus atratus]|uniref:dynactin subunit 6 isoform X1 n=1 Tax=Cygnus atratus TaxID=8868 RepID=UPI0015D58BCA|nr:dynactin subunit 6 isoform X1 [Cygnus atratus]
MAEKAQKSVKIAPGAVVCVESEIRGDVTIGPRTVIHPKARIIAEAGPIVIGEGNLIEEQALIINGYPENITPETEQMEPKPMVIGTNNVFEVGCYSQAMKVGDNNVIESKGEFRLTVLAPVKVSLGSPSSPHSDFCSCRCWEQEGINHLAVDVPKLQLIALHKLFSHWRAPAEATWAGAGSGWRRWVVCVWAQWRCCLRKCSRATSAALCAQKPEAELERLTEAGQRHGVEKHRAAPSGAARARPLQGLLSLSLAAFVGRNVILTSGCIIGACCNVNTYEVIPENTVIYGADCLRRVQTERPQPQTLQLDFLMKILPNYHHLKKTMKTASTPVKS